MTHRDYENWTWFTSFRSQWSISLHFPLLREGCIGSSSKSSRHTSRSSITSIISLGRPTVFSHLFGDFEVWILKLVFEVFPLGFCWYKWPNYFSQDFSIRRSNGSMFRNFGIPVLRFLSDKVTSSIFCKNLILNICTCNHTFSVITQHKIKKNWNWNATFVLQYYC